MSDDRHCHTDVPASQGHSLRAWPRRLDLDGNTGDCGGLDRPLLETPPVHRRNPARPVTFTEVCEAVTTYGIACYLDTARDGWLSEDSPPSRTYATFQDLLHTLITQKEER